MKRETYIKFTDFFRQPGWHAHLLFILCRMIPVIIANIYGILCVLFFFIKPAILLRFAGIPLIGFFAVSLLRFFIHRKRPYETLDFYPITYKNKAKSGSSFPSRHTASAALIAMAIYAYMPILGWMMLFLAILVGISRVFSGMHYISDVVVGFAFGVIVGLIGFYPLIF